MGGAFNICLAHDEPGIFDETLQRWESAARAVADIYRSNDPAARLRGRPIEPVFKVRDE
jgi:hypothetical protein